MSKPTTSQQRRIEAVIASVILALQGEGFDPDEVVYDPSKPITIEGLTRQIVIGGVIATHHDCVQHKVLEANRQDVWDAFTLAYENGNDDDE